MPLVFVHGVATRQGGDYDARVKQRDQLFKSLVLRPDSLVLDPYWGGGGVRFTPGEPWLPNPGENEVFAFGTPVIGPGRSIAAALGRKDPAQAVDLAFVAILEEQAKAAQGAAPAITQEQLAAFEAAVKYLDSNPSGTVFDADESDAVFADALRSQIGRLLPPPATGEAMGIGDIFASIGRAVGRITDPLRNAASDALLRLGRRPISQAVALFLGDVFVYLRNRDRAPDLIFKPIADKLIEAVKAPGNEKLIVVGHSLGGVILYDLLTTPSQLQRIADEAGKPLSIDALVTVGAQPGLFADMGLYPPQAAAGKRPRPACVQRWMNVFDYTDVLSFRCVPFFDGVEDYAFDDVAGLLEAHGAYFLRPSFYQRLHLRLNER